MRQAEIVRKTAETDIQLSLNLDGTGRYSNNTGVGFLDHMLDLFARHGRFDLTVTCKGDIDVDFHHTVEDVGITLGLAFAKALGDKRGIVRYGQFLLPMDEALVQVAVDIGGRGFLNFGLDIPSQKVGDFDTELVSEFWLGLIRGMGACVHFRQLEGTNSHHIIEAAFKGAGRAFAQAVAIDARYPQEIPSTKGVL